MLTNTNTQRIIKHYSMQLHTRKKCKKILHTIETVEVLLGKLIVTSKYIPAKRKPLRNTIKITINVEINIYCKINIFTRTRARAHA